MASILIVKFIAKVAEYFIYYGLYENKVHVLIRSVNMCK